MFVANSGLGLVISKGSKKSSKILTLIPLPSQLFSVPLQMKRCYNLSQGMVQTFLTTCVASFFLYPKLSCLPIEIKQMSGIDTYSPMEELDKSFSSFVTTSIVVTIAVFVYTIHKVIFSVLHYWAVRCASLLVILYV